jgi:hypothetical protein
MKRIVMITVFAVLLLSAAATTTVMAKEHAVTALSCESPAMPSPFAGQPFHITGILTDGTSGTPVPDRLITVYMLTDGKKWMEIGSNSTDESGQYNVTTRQDTADTYFYRAVFDGDKSFRKVTSPTTEVSVNPLPRLIPWTSVSFFELHNNGWFVAKLACYYSTDDGVTWKESGHTGGIGMTDYVYMPLDALGVPDGALVKIHVIVVGGNDKTGSTVFRYVADNNFYWHGPEWVYYIYGTTLNPRLEGPYDGNP